MSVAVQFPDDLRIAFALLVEWTQLAPMRERSARARDGIQMPINRRIRRGAELQIGMAEKRESARKRGFRRFDDRVAFCGEALVHHRDDRPPLFERGQKAPGPCPHPMAQQVSRAFAGSVAPDWIELVGKLFVAHLRRSRTKQAVANFGESLAGANPQLVKTHPANFAELFKTDRHISSLSQRKTGRIADLNRA